MASDKLAGRWVHFHWFPDTLNAVASVAPSGGSQADEKPIAVAREGRPEVRSCIERPSARGRPVGGPQALASVCWRHFRHMGRQAQVVGSSHCGSRFRG